jgi:hypothetical protein
MNTEETTKKNGNAKGLPKIEPAVETMKASETSAKKLPEAAHAELKRLFARISGAREQLGGVAYEIHRLQAQSQVIAGKLASDDNEAKALLDAAAKQLGVTGEGWRFDIQTGEFTRTS